MLFEYYDTVPPVESTKVVLQAPPTPVSPRTTWERTLAPLHISWEADLIHQQKMFCLDDWKSIPVNHHLHPIKSSEMGSHGHGR